MYRGAAQSIGRRVQSPLESELQAILMGYSTLLELRIAKDPRGNRLLDCKRNTTRQ